MLSVTIDRTSLGTSALTLLDFPSGTSSIWIPKDGIEWPRFGRRKEYAPNVRYLSGRTLLARVSDIGTLPLTVHAEAASSAALDALKAQLQAAVDQWMYDLTLTVDGVAATYTAECVDDDIAWGDINSQQVGAHLALGTFAVPLYPA